MSETIEVEATEVIERKPSFVQAVFGQLKDPEFWLSVIRTMFREACQAFMAALGGELLRYGTSGRYQPVGMPAQSTVAQKAFGNAYSPTPSYQPSMSYPVPVSSPSGDARFPGFGGPR